MSVKYSFNENNEFIIEDYDRAGAFASFLPGIAGTGGIPAWAFYVNRGQVLGSFGVRDKNGAIMEFFPANAMYRNIDRLGFRTFVRKDGATHELFSPTSPDNCSRALSIGRNLVKVSESNLTLGLKTTVTYFVLPGEDFAAVVRKVEFKNLAAGKNEVEILDGLPQIIPAGAGNSSYQAMSNLLRSWFDVTCSVQGIAFYRTRGSIEDKPEVQQSTSANFFLAFSSESSGLLPPIYDMDLIFGSNSALSYPKGWDKRADELHIKRQVPQNKVSGGFSGVCASIEDTFTLCIVIGHTKDPKAICEKSNEFTVDYIEKKEKEAEALIEQLLQDVSTKTSSRLFNKYIEQCYLDNFIRGGYPAVFKAGPKKRVYHLFSRKHGDLEREYNFFSQEPAFYSQGNGNYRDVNQNRRNDVLIRPEVEDFDIRHMASLLQADGYNPLIVKGCRFKLEAGSESEVLELIPAFREEAARLLGSGFTPGEFISFLRERGLSPGLPEEEFLGRVLSASTQEFEAEFGEGFWSDHWTYNLDLVEAYLTVYPDLKEKLLFSDKTCLFFQSPVFVQPRSEKYVLADGKVRQREAVRELSHDSRNGKPGETVWLKDGHGNGSPYRTSLFSKLFILALVKFSSLDPFGMGIEMEAGRPGWNDALNGLPGLLGSGLSETIELKRLIDFLIKACREYDTATGLFSEAAELLNGVSKLLDDHLSGGLDDFSYWDGVSTLREEYRSKTCRSIDGKEVSLGTRDLLSILEKFERKLDAGLERALSYGGGIYPTYFYYEATGFETAIDSAGLSGTSPAGASAPGSNPHIRVTGFTCNPLPHFLEAPARILGSLQGSTEAKKLYEQVKSSELYDRKLNMYKTSVPLEGVSSEIGRLMSFTPGWLEREAVFLHMEYKYLYAVLKAGLYDEFFQDIRYMLVPFLKPETYGRSTLENSSFIASSSNPDEEMHGRGFAARMTGSSAELLSMWFLMMAGREVFSTCEKGLALRLEPILPGWLFDDDGKVSFTFLGKVTVTYTNPCKCDTFGKGSVKPAKYTLMLPDKSRHEIVGRSIYAPYSGMVRDGDISEIEVLLG